MLSARPILYSATENFIRANNGFESSVPVNAAIEDVGKSSSLQEIFLIPLQRQLFSLDVALKWILFLKVAPDHAVELGETLFPSAPLNVQIAFSTIIQVYDLGIQVAIWEHFVDEDEEEDTDEEETEKEKNMEG
jgi:hypothetical protein